MARNVFISFLGTTDYTEAEYKWPNGDLSSKTRFIQTAILEKKAQTWTSNDRIYIFFTKKSHTRNWLNCGQKDKNKRLIKEGIHAKGLKDCIKELGIKAKCIGCSIEDGYTEDEIWEIFEKVYSKIKNGDQIYFDMTHAFRSIPIFASTLFNFAQYMKKAEVVSINYGAFVDGTAEIVDMTNIVKLQSLIETATSITEFGRIPKSISANIIGLSDGKDKNTMNCIINGISELDKFIQSNRQEGIKSGSYLKKLESAKKPFRKSDTIREPVRIIINDINDKLNTYGFSTNGGKNNIIAAIKWAKNFNMLTQAYTLAQEYILTVLCEKFECFNPYHSEEPEEDLINYRTFISAVLTIEKKKVISNELYDIFKKYPYNFFSLLQDEVIIRLRENDAYPKLAQYRNIVNHGKGDAKNDSKGNTSFETIKDVFEKTSNKCLNILQELDNT